ncbi:aldo/keto reductase [Amycolatopsis sp. NPDC049252]|uniref:aldo/keto reductase n=1 Tax=Amycolatopsis sp. NPDC049252 TaxID=3363933 RepID=UPI003719D9F5
MKRTTLGDTGLEVSELGFDFSAGRVVRSAHESLERLETDHVDAVGVTGYPPAAPAYVAERTRVDTIVSSCRYTLQNRQLATWRDWFTRHGTAVINASPLSMGALTNRGAPPWHPAPPDVLARCAEAGALCGARGEELARVALRFAVTTGGFAGTLVGADDPAEVHRNVRWITEPVDENLLREVEACLEPVRDRSWPSGRPESRPA